MTTTAIICELNPLHSGHKKLIDYAKTFSDKVICIMSGNFVQRGLPACCDKYSRATHAVKCGADLVVELPTVFATSSATDFAIGGVLVANDLHADYLLFGSECGDLQQLQNCAKLLDDKDVNSNIRKYVGEGNNYPTAVYKATNCNLLDKPNNTLAIEYLRALTATNSPITPVTIKREDNYNGKTGEYASSSALRNDKTLFDKYSFDFVANDVDISIEQRYCKFATVALSLFSKEHLRNIYGVSEGIENRFISADKSNGYDAMLEQVKTKRYTRAKLQRIVLHAVLDITEQDVTKAKNFPLAITPLAVSAQSTDLLQLTNEFSDEITKRADNLYTSLGGKTKPKKLIKI